MKYDVTVFKTSQDKVTIEAESRDEAETKASEMFYSGEYVFSEDAEPYFDFDAEEAKPEKIKVLLLEPDKVAKVVEIGTSLEAMQKVVGGLIETAYYFDDPVVLVVNDEGKINGMPLNRGIYDQNKKLVDIIAGTAFLCGDNGERFTDLSDEMIKKYSQKLKYPERFFKVNGDIKGVPIKPMKEHER